MDDFETYDPWEAQEDYNRFEEEQVAQDREDDSESLRGYYDHVEPEHFDFLDDMNY